MIGNTFSKNIYLSDMEEERETESEEEEEEGESGGEAWQPDLSNLSSAEEPSGGGGEGQLDYNTRGKLYC